MSDAARVLHRRVAGHDAPLEGWRVRDVSNQTINSRLIERVVDEDVGSLGELDEIVRGRGV